MTAITVFHKHDGDHHDDFNRPAHRGVACLMRPGCLSITRSEDGLIDRHRVKSVAYKGKETRGEEAEWITIAPVAVAISVLEQLIIRSTEHRGTKTLWPVLFIARARKQTLSTDIVTRLNQFRNHLTNASEPQASRSFRLVPMGARGN